MMSKFLSLDLSGNGGFITSFFNPHISWYFYMICFMSMSFCFMCYYGRFQTMFLIICSQVYEICDGMGSKRVVGYNHILLSLFFYTSIFNLFSFFPLLKPIASHPAFLWGIIFPLWGSVVIYSITSSISGFLVNLMPTGAPLWMACFLSSMEIMSFLCRPFSLSLRMLVNMTVGQILLCWHLREVSMVIADGFMFHNSMSLRIVLYTLMTLFHIWWNMLISVFQPVVMVGLLSLYCADVPLIHQSNKSPMKTTGSFFWSVPKCILYSKFLLENMGNSFYDGF